MTNLETQSGSIVNWAHVMNVEIVQTHYATEHIEGDVDKWSVMAYPAFPIEYPGIGLYTSNNHSHCESYMEWLKAQLDMQSGTDNTVIRHDFEPPFSTQPADKTRRYYENGDKVTWRDANGKEHTGTFVCPAEQMGYYEVQDDDGSYHFSIPAADLNFIED